MMKKIVCIIGLFLLAGCLGGYSPESTFYTLKTIDEAKPVSQTNISIGVDLPELPEYADRPQIVSYSKSGSLNIDETNRWGEDLDIMLQRVIANDLRGYLPKAGIKPRTSLLEKYRYILNVSVVKFDLIENNRAYFGTVFLCRHAIICRYFFQYTAKKFKKSEHFIFCPIAIFAFLCYTMKPVALNPRRKISDG